MNTKTNKYEHKANNSTAWWWTQKQTSPNTKLTTPQRGDEHKNKQVLTQS